MTDPSLKEENGEQRGKKIVAAVLLVIMVAAFAHAGHWLYQEASSVCEGISREFEMMGATRAPCVASYVEGPEEVLVRRARLTYSAGGGLARMESRDPATGEDSVLDCTFFGRVALIFREPELWLNKGVAQAMSKNVEELALARGVVDEEVRAGVPQQDGQVFERVTLRRVNREGEAEWSDVRLLDEDQRIVERVLTLGPPGLHETMWRHEFDEERNVRVRRVETLLYGELTVRESRYEYACGD
ncbi:MAG: hypothetical protein ACNA8W_12040 [Bradymonadaceae bacterium]